MSYKHVKKIPEVGSKITVNDDLSLNVPDDPIIPFIEGDGIGIDISPVMIKVIDAAVEKHIPTKENIVGWKYIVEKKRPSYTKVIGSPQKRWMQ